MPLDPTTNFTINPTTNFISYLSDLATCGKIGKQELRELVERLKIPQLSNPIPEKPDDGTVRKLLFGGLQRLIAEGNVDRGKLLDWSRNKLEEMNRTCKGREESCTETQPSYHKMEFNCIKHGSFEMDLGTDKKKVTIAEDFEMMSTLVTQMQWFIIMGENPSYFVDGKYTAEIIINDKPIKMQPDNPVECVNSVEEQNSNFYRKSVFAFIEKLKKRSQGKEPDPILEQLITGHRQGDCYRLPTEREWEYVVSNLGSSHGIRCVGDSEAELEKYVLYRSNDESMTYPVTDKSPLMVDGRLFYDLYGNVQEWVQDSYRLGRSGQRRRVLGVSRHDSAQNLRYTFRAAFNPCTRDKRLGFRLVRKRK